MIKSSLAAEPWRFACIECKSVSISPRGMTDGRGPITDFDGRYYVCNQCNHKNEKVFDKKTEKKVAL
jgi:hypothetical protein